MKLRGTFLVIVLQLLLVLSLTTGCSDRAVPELPGYTVKADSAKTQGYYFLSPHKPDPFKSPFSSFNMILDSLGELVYFKKFDGGSKLADFKLQDNGMMTYYFRDKYFIMDSTFNIVDSVSQTKEFGKDPHEIQVLPNGNYVLLAVETVTMDLSGYIFNGVKGKAGTPVVSAVIQEFDKNKNVVFEWHAKDHFRFSDADMSYLTKQDPVDWTHCNAIELSHDGNYLLSSRNFNEITKISRSSGAIIWRFGGNANQFTFVNGEGKFTGQHDIRQNADGNYSFLDNGSNHPNFRPATVKEYRLDEIAMTASLVWSHTEDPAANSKEGLGNVQRLPDGNTLVNYGKFQSHQLMFNVITKDRKKIFEISFEDSLRTYRAFNYQRLWTIKRPEIIIERIEGKIYLVAKTGHDKYYWSGGESGQKLEVKEPGKYFLIVPDGKKGFLCSKPAFIQTL